MSPPLDLRQLRYFVAVAEELHFSRAARRLHMSQPPLSQQIHRLETELGVLLLQRTKRRVVLTEAGRVLLAEGKRILREVDQAVEAAQRTSRGEAGHLAIGFVSSAPYEMLPATLGAFRRQYPRVQLSITELNSTVQVDALLDSRIDVGLVRTPLDHGLGVVLETVAREHLVVALPRDHPLAQHTRVRLAELADSPMVTTPRSESVAFYDAIISACHLSGFSPDIVAEASQASGMVALVAAGSGAAILPASTARIQLPDVVYRPIAPPIFHLDLAVAVRAGERAPLVQRFLETVHDAVRTTPLTAYTPA